MKIDTLNELNNEQLQSVISRAEELLKDRDRERKAKALSDARALLASAGLSLKDLGARQRTKKAPTYQGGHHYQHPSDPALTWNAKGKKPAWLIALEKEGGKAMEIATESTGAGETVKP